MKNIATAYMAKRYAMGGKPKLGTGKRFANLEHSLAHKPGISDPAALAASIGRKKYGSEKMEKLSEHKMAHGGQVNPKLMAAHQHIKSNSELPDEGDMMAEGGQMCAHGGPAMCAYGCYDEGGEVHDAEGFSDDDNDLFDESGEQSRFDNGIEDHEDTELGDIDSDIDHEDSATLTRYAKGGMIKNLLHKIMKGHRGH